MWSASACECVALGMVCEFAMIDKGLPQNWNSPITRKKESLIVDRRVLVMFVADEMRNYKRSTCNPSLAWSCMLSQCFLECLWYFCVHCFSHFCIICVSLYSWVMLKDANNRLTLKFPLTHRPPNGPPAESPVCSHTDPPTDRPVVCPREWRRTIIRGWGRGQGIRRSWWGGAENEIVENLHYNSDFFANKIQLNST